MTRSRRHKLMQSAGVFNIGRETAEDDPLLLQAFYETAKFQSLRSKQERSVILLGRTGTGKSAALRRLEQVFPDNVIKLRPQDMALPYLTNLDVIQKLSTQGVRLDPFFTALWKHVFLIEIMKHRYKIDSKEKQNNVLSELKLKFGSDRGRQLCLEYVEQFGDKFWCDTDERVMQVAERFCEKIQAASEASVEVGISGASLAAGLGGGAATDHSVTISKEISNRYQRVVDATQIAKINAMIGELNNEILTKAHYTFFMIDDLDRDWADESIRNALIRCLLEAVLDMGRVVNLKMIVAMRKNIISQLDYGSQKRGPQQEKIDQMIMHMNWSTSELWQLADNRIRAASEVYGIEPPLTLSGFMPNVNKTRGDAMDFIFDRTLKRPRDVILYLNEVISVSNQNRRLTWDHIRGAEVGYSKKRFEALRDEWKDPYFHLEVVLERFRRKPETLTKKEYFAILDDVATYESSNSVFGTEKWLMEACEPFWRPSTNGAAENEEYLPITRILFEIGVLGITSVHDKSPFYVFDADQESEFFDLEGTEFFVIHPAFRVFLQTKVRPRISSLTES